MLCRLPTLASFALTTLAAIALPIEASAEHPSCKQLSKARSEASSVATKIIFKNQSDTVRGILWLDFSGQPKDYASLNPGEQAEFNTFLTHPWMITTGPGDCLKIVQPQAGGSVEVMNANDVISQNLSGGENGEEESSVNTSCPPGTVPVPETDACMAENEAQRCRDQREGCDLGVKEACRNLARWDCPATLR